jgi:hypothetical protein
MDVKINGRVVSADALLASAPKRKAKPKAEAPAASHKGYRVVGHYPGELEDARKFNASEWARWNSHTPEARSEALKKGKRPPPMWDEQQWRLHTKKTAVRSRPYEISAAADQCAELARKVGWLDVEVLEVKRGEAPPPGMF